MTSKDEPALTAPAPVIVGVDGSSGSKKAIEWAVGYARLASVPVELLLAWSPVYTYGWPVALPAEYDPAGDAQRLLSKIVAEVVAAYPDVDVRSRAVEGDPRNVLLHESRRASLLVVGSRGHGEVVGVLLGSVGGYCASHAQCPVVVVRNVEAPGSNGAV